MIVLNVVLRVRIRKENVPSAELTKTSDFAISPMVFHLKLKTLLYNISYPDSSSTPTSFAISSLYTIHHGRLTFYLPDSLDLDPACPFIHSFISDICIAPLQVGLLRSAPNPSAAE